MGEKPTLKNNWAASVSGAVHIIFTIGLKAGKEAIKTQLPFLRLPVVSWVFDFVVNRFGDYIDTELQLHATFIVMDLQTYQEKKAYEEAKEALKKAKEQGNQDEINKAKEDFKNRIGDLIRWNGST